MHGLAEHGLVVHDLLLDGVGEEPAPQARIPEQIRILERHDIRLIRERLEGNHRPLPSLLIEWQRSRMKQVAGDVPDYKDRKAKKRQQEHQERLRRCLQPRQALDCCERIGGREQEMKSQSYHHDDCTASPSPVSMPARASRCRTSASVSPVTSGNSR